MFLSRSPSQALLDELVVRWKLLQERYEEAQGLYTKLQGHDEHAAIDQSLADIRPLLRTVGEEIELPIYTELARDPRSHLKELLKRHERWQEARERSTRKLQAQEAKGYTYTTQIFYTPKSSYFTSKEFSDWREAVVGRELLVEKGADIGSMYVRRERGQKSTLLVEGVQGTGELKAIQQQMSSNPLDAEELRKVEYIVGQLDEDPIGFLGSVDDQLKKAESTCDRAHHELIDLQSFLEDEERIRSVDIEELEESVERSLYEQASIRQALGLREE